jgi:hypothetical protein
MTRQVGADVAERSNLKNRAVTETATTSAASTAVPWLKPNGNGHDKENGLRNGYNGNGKDHLKSGPQWSEGLGAPHCDCKYLATSFATSSEPRLLQCESLGR